MQDILHSVTLQYLFDNIRNYTLATTVVIAGLNGYQVEVIQISAYLISSWYLAFSLSPNYRKGPGRVILFF